MDTFVVTKTRLTAKYASHPNRLGVWTPQYLHLYLIPQLVKEQHVEPFERDGKKVVYRFIVEV